MEEFFECFVHSLEHRGALQQQSCGRPGGSCTIGMLAGLGMWLPPVKWQCSCHAPASQPLACQTQTTKGQTTDDFQLTENATSSSLAVEKDGVLRL